MIQSIFFEYEIKKKTISDYKNVIFDETQYYDQQEESKLIKKSEKLNLMKFQTRDFRSTFEMIDNDKKN